MPRIATLSVLALLAVVLSGCVSIKSQTAFQRLPGFVTLRLDVCVSDRDRSTYATCDPSDPDRNTEETDNGFDGDGASGRGQLLVGFRVPVGTGAPATFASTDGRGSFTRNAGYTALLNANFAPPAGFRWEGYSSTDVPFDPDQEQDRAARLEPEFTLPAGAGGAPFTGPFRWRAVVGFRQTGAGAANPGDPIVCNTVAGTVCFDSPIAGIPSSLSQAVSDLGVLSGRGDPVGQGQTAELTFPIQNLDGGGLGARTVTLSASTNLPGATAAPSAGSVSVPAERGSLRFGPRHRAARHPAADLHRDPDRHLRGVAAGEYGHDHRRRQARPDDPRQHPVRWRDASWPANACPPTTPAPSSPTARACAAAPARSPMELLSTRPPRATRPSA